MIAPSGPVYQAGTLSGNPLAMAAGIETLKIIDEDPAFYAGSKDTSAKIVSSRDSGCAGGGRCAQLHIQPLRLDVHALLY